MKRISIFGATGSIGQNTLELIRRDKASYDVVALTGDQNIAQLVRDVNEFRPKIVVTADTKLRSELEEALTNTDCEVAAGSEAIAEAASRPTDWVMSCIVGSAGLVPGLNALRAGTTLALANKESLVTAGPLLTATAERFSSSIIPVDSEHSAIFQALLGEKISSVERIIITASGGAFRDWPQADLAKVTPQQAQNHPNWS
ncbi:MAG: 1-deoxy-D-xylulose-5-phosphate reductoisomerase, partial [Planktomarina sp.]|nr:1-deoxy-D-xylulose-5-phosphate reductoisomerase [Planktomarina sp.]